MIGILAYGSLLVSAGWEIEEATRVIEERVETPFEVEYARKSRGRAYAPTLVPVEDDKGSSVAAKIIVLKPQMSEEATKDILYRREIDRVGDKSRPYDPPDPAGENTVLIGETDAFRELGFENVFYTYIATNLPEILDDEVGDEKKARLLACLAIESVTEKTFFRCRDGIRYLDDAINLGIKTPLTDLYNKAILEMAGGAADLEEARIRIAKDRCILLDDVQ